MEDEDMESDIAIPNRVSQKIISILQFGQILFQ